MAGFREAQGDLRLENVTKAFSEFVAVDDLSLRVPRGSFFALLGPSGCGKTTTLRMVAGLEQPTSGRILIGDTDLTGSRSYERPVNTVFQSYALFPHLTIRDNVAFGPKRRGLKDAARLADEALELVQLPHLAARKPTQLSGGQQQRVAVARALVNRPEVLLLDEPLPTDIMNVPSVLVELADQRAHWQPGQASHVVNLSLLPLTPTDIAHLDHQLGTGRVLILSRGYGNCRITNCAVPDTWRVVYYNSQDAVILNSVEVCDMPEVACAAPEDLMDSMERMTEVLQWVNQA